jgi:hypothetical protein
MKNIRSLELHVAHACNLTCEGCSHYSNQGHKGWLSLSEAESWMKAWKTRLRPREFSLLGGEPTINPDLPGFVSLARDNWPEATLRLVTNGFFLHRHPDLPLRMKEASNAYIVLSVHHHSDEYRKKIEPILDLLEEWKNRYGIQAGYYTSYNNWTRRYNGFGSAMAPFDDRRPRESWENCPAKYCPQLYEGKIWKCAQLAYLPLQNARHSLSDRWAPYLGYQPLNADCTDQELQEFFEREEESHCSMCPANPEKFELPAPMPGRIEIQPR